MPKDTDFQQLLIFQYTPWSLLQNLASYGWGRHQAIQVALVHRVSISIHAMAPKLSKSEKQDLILSYLRSSRTCHTLKDLEKVLPSVASINGIQVKEYIQALTDEGNLRVEKIGSGNWYWCFGSEEKKERETKLSQLREEVDKARKSCEEAELGLATERRKRDEEQEQGEAEGKEREALCARKMELEMQLRQLRAEEAEWVDSSSSGPGGVAKKKEEVDIWKREALMWTDNIYILEEYLRKLAGGDRELVEGMKRECYGDEYVEGEGLRELDADA